MTTATLHHPNPQHSREATWLGVGAIVAGVGFVAVLGAWVTATSVTTWYPTVPKPAWTPPNGVFGPVWSVLYVMMAAAAILVWLARDRTDVRLGAFALQLALNLTWSVFFFGLRSPLLGFLDICLLWVAIAFTAAQFFLVSRAAGWLLVPYQAWVTFAAAINGSILIHGG